MLKLTLLAAAAFAVGAASATAAQESGHQHGAPAAHQPAGHAAPQQTGHAASRHAGHGARTSRRDSVTTKEFKAAHAKMMRDMDVPFTGDVDADFRTHMIPHHQGALDMARVALRRANDSGTRQIAEAITTGQSREIYEFRAWLARHETAKNRNSAAVREFKAAHAKMMRAMDMPFTGDPDVDFRMHMIPHHQGAIDMSRVALRHAKDPWTRQAAETIIVDQQREIAQFQGWFAARGAMVPAGGKPLYTIGSNSLVGIDRGPGDDAGSRGELVGQTWAPGSGVPRLP